MGDLRDCPPTLYEIYEGLTDAERKLLSREFVLSRRIPDSLAFMRSLPYPLVEDDAAMVANIARQYVYPWTDLQSRYLNLWARDRLPKGRGISMLPPFEEIDAVYFPDPDDLRDFQDGSDFTYGLAGIRDEEFEEHLHDLQQVITAASEGGECELGYSVPLPLPFGPPSLTRIPLIEGSWIDRHVVDLAEWCGELFHAGYRRLPSLDPHPLAWHRLYPPGTDWATPREAEQTIVMELRQQSSTRLGRYRGRRRDFGGRSHLHIEDYSGWKRRLVPGELMTRRTTGIVVEAWNAWIDRESDDGLLDLFFGVVGRIDHPVQVRERPNYVVTSQPDLVVAERLRRAAIIELIELAHDRVMKTSPEELFTNVQLTILKALEKKPCQTADNLHKNMGYSRARLYQRGGIKELMDREPPLVIRCPGRGGYSLATAKPSDLPR